MLKKVPRIYAFIDSQNLNLGTSDDIYRGRKLIYEGWKLDLKKFRKYLDIKFHVEKAYLFLGYIPAYENMYKLFKRYGYEIIFKPTVKDNKGKPKGNVDAEIVLYSAAILYNKYDKAVFISGDGDFYCLYEYMEQKNKLGTILIPNKFSKSKFLNRFNKYCKYIYRDKDILKKRK